jgi:AcrR family transcriptional regulator
MSPRPRRGAQQSNLQERILATAWKQIAEFGAPTLSLRAIARELEITAPAIYNYFPRRDDLVTALIIEAYTDFGDRQLAALDGAPASDPAGRLMAVGVAYRQWALNYPERYQLIFGTPIPGYAAPHEKVLPIAARSMTALVSVVEALHRQGRLRVPSALTVDPDRLALFDEWKKVGIEADIQSFSVAILIWGRVHGLVSLEISNNLPPFGPLPAALYQAELEAIGNEFTQEVEYESAHS